MFLRRWRELLTLGWGLGICIPAQAVPLTTTRVASGLNRPIGAFAAPGDTSRLFIIEKQGRIQILDLTNGQIKPNPFLDIDANVGGGTSTNDERGLLGLAFHPDYAANGYFYVDYTNNSGNTVIARFSRVEGNDDQADSGSEQMLLSIAQPYSNHNGGWVAFGPDGYLYIAMGDGGLYCDPSQNAQDLTSNLLGKILRIDVNGDDFPGDATRNYAIPQTNPFVGLAGDDEIWVYGLRNPWRNDFDNLTGDLYIADVGQDAVEEIDFLPAGRSGLNFGWDCMEGNACSSVAPSSCSPSGCSCNAAGLTPPVYQYSHGNGCSVSGGFVYRGCRIPELQGEYFLADYCSARIWSFHLANGVATGVTTRETELDPAGSLSIGSITSFGEDAEGEIYIVEQGTSSNLGEVFKIVPLNDLPNDINADGSINQLDVIFMVLALLDGGGLDPALICRSDVNDDGALNGDDVQAWIGNL